MPQIFNSYREKGLEKSSASFGSRALVHELWFNRDELLIHGAHPSPQNKLRHVVIKADTITFEGNIEVTGTVNGHRI